MNWKKGILLGACLLLVGCKLTYNQGYEDGFKDGYCKDRTVCKPPKPFKGSKGYFKLDSVSAFNYDAGYKWGDANGQMMAIKEELAETQKLLDARKKELNSN